MYYSLHLRNHKKGLSCTCTIEACTYQRMQTSEATTSRHVCSTHGRLITHKKIGDFEGGGGTCPLRPPPLNPPLNNSLGSSTHLASCVSISWYMPWTAEKGESDSRNHHRGAVTNLPRRSSARQLTTDSIRQFIR